LTHEEFSDFWLHQLTKHTRTTPGKSGYRQVHADPELTRSAAEAAGVSIDDVDGIALEWYPDLTSFGLALAWADRPRAENIEAEEQMSDIERALAMLSCSSSP
jgi:hypothetical protein